MNNLQFTVQTNQKELERLQEAFSAITSDITLSSKDWRELMESGALASLAISRFRGHKALSSADLGISQEEYKEVESIVSLGYRLLLPKEVLGAFNSLESNARQVLRRYTIKVPSGYFLPASAYAACAASMEDHKLKFEALVTRLLEELEAHKVTIKEQYQVLSAQVANRLFNAGLLAYANKWTFEDEFTTRCMATFPTREELESQFSFRLSLAFVPVPYQTNQEAPQYANASADLVSLRRAVLEEQARVQSEEVTGFIKSIRSEVYALVNDALSQVLESAGDKMYLQSRSVVQLRGLVERLGQLNFWNDPKLELVKQEISAILDRAPSKRDFAIDQALLSAMQSEVQITLRSIAGIERGNMDLSQGPTSAQIKLPSMEERPAPIKITQAPTSAPSKLPAPQFSSASRSSKPF